MAPSTPPAAPHRHGRRIRTALRSLSPSSVVAVTLALLLGGASAADAANGGSFLLGKANTETATASLSDTAGTPLKLTAPAGKAPLAVNQKTMVNNLNAQFTGGLSAAQLQATGGEGFTSPVSDIPLNTHPATVANTGPLPAGTYYVSATAELEVVPGDLQGDCFIAKASAPGTIINEGATAEGVVSVAETAAVTVTAGDLLEENCFVDNSNGSLTVDAGIIAIRILANNQG